MTEEELDPQIIRFIARDRFPYTADEQAADFVTAFIPGNTNGMGALYRTLITFKREVQREERARCREVVEAEKPKTIDDQFDCGFAEGVRGSIGAIDALPEILNA